LTFFYRQMPELIEKGYLYIAQPPLYRVKKGKQEHYVKDDEALRSYLTQIALEGAALYPSQEAPPIQGVGLETLVSEYNMVQQIIRKLSKRYPASILEMLIHMPVIKQEQLTDNNIVNEWVANLQEALIKATQNGDTFSITIKEDHETKQYL